MSSKRPEAEETALIDRAGEILAIINGGIHARTLRERAKHFASEHLDEDKSQPGKKMPPLDLLKAERERANRVLTDTARALALIEQERGEPFPRERIAAEVLSLLGDSQELIGNIAYLKSKKNGASGNNQPRM